MHYKYNTSPKLDTITISTQNFGYNMTSIQHQQKDNQILISIQNQIKEIQH